MSIRERIKNRIKDLGLSQRQVSMALGVAEQNLSGFLYGRRTYSLRRIISLMEILGLSIGRKDSLIGKLPPAYLRFELSEMVKSKAILLKEVARLAGINACSISSFFSGKRSLSLKSLERLMDALDEDVVCYGEPKISAQSD